MHLLVPLQHLHELGNLLRACFGLLDGLNPEQDGVSISAIKRFEELPGARIAVKRGLEVAWHRGLAGRVIRGFPAPVTFGALDFLEAGGFHFSRFDQGKRLFPVDLRPDALVRAPGEFLQPELLAMGLLLPIDPSEAKRGLNGFVVRNGPCVGAFFCELQPYAG